MSIRIGAFEGRMPGDKKCDVSLRVSFGIDAEHCDPYVKIYFDNESDHRFQTKSKQDVKRWTTFDETYYSDRISKDTSVTIKIFDDNGGNDKLIFENTKKIGELLNTTLIEGSDVKLFLYSVWSDEYENSK